MGLIVQDYRKVNVHDKESRKQLLGALQYFLSAHTRPEVKAAMQHFGTTDDVPANVKEILNKYQLTNYVDNGWEQLFTFADFTGTNKDGFKIAEVADGLVFKDIPEGSEVQIGKVAGDEITVSFTTYGGGLGWSRQLWDDGDWWGIEQKAIAFRNKYLYKRAAIGNALIEAISSGQNLAWQNPTPAALANTDRWYVASRDANTINAACLGILGDLKNKGMDVGPNTQFVLYAPLALRDRITAAMAFMPNGTAGGPRAVAYNITVAYTLLLSSTTSYYVAVPGEKSIWGDRKALEVYDEFDIRRYADIAVGWARFGAAIGEVKQFRRCATS